jgi:transcriptional regulator with XRE-family HTH domain
MKLANYMKKENLTDKAFAAQLEMTRTTVSRFRRDKAKPSRQAIIRIAEATKGKVRFQDWLET